MKSPKAALLCLGIALALIPSCRRGPSAPIVSSPLPPDKAQTVMVSYLGGSVELQRSGGKSAAEIGMELQIGDVLSTGDDSLCEIRVGSVSTIRMGEKAILAIDQASIGEASTRIQLALKAGTILQKVNKLRGTDSYAIRTPSAVCGVRGTTFAVTAQESGSSLVAVQEGRVVVLPASAALDELAARSASNGAARAAMKSLLAVAPGVESGQEYQSPAAGSSDKGFDKLLSAIEAMDYPPDSEQAPLPGLIPAGDIDAPDLPEARNAVMVVVSNLALGAPRAPEADGKLLLSEMQVLFPVERGAPAEKRPSPKATGAASPAAASPAASGAALPSPSAQAPTPQPSSGIVLDPAITGYRPGAGKPIRGDLVSFHKLVLSLDSAGVLTAWKPDGGQEWSLNTGLRMAQATSPIVSGENILIAADGRLLCLDGATKTEVFNIPLQEGIPAGMDIHQSAKGIVVPGADAVFYYNPDEVGPIRKYPVPEGLALSPIVTADPSNPDEMRADRLAILRKDGFLEFRALDSAEASGSYNTGFRTSMGLAMRAVGGKFLFTDSSGGTMIFDPKSPVRKTPGLNFVQAETLKADPEYGPAAIVLSTAKGVWILDPSNLEVRSIIRNTNGPILLSKGIVYAGTNDGRLLMTDAADGSMLKSIFLPAQVSARPLIVDGKLWIGCMDGSMVFIEVKNLPVPQ